MSGLLSIVGHVEGDPTLALGLVQDLVHGVEHGHGLVHPDQLIVAELGVVGGVDHGPLPVHHPVHGDAVIGVRLEEAPVLGVNGVGARELGHAVAVVGHELCEKERKVCLKLVLKRASQ